MPIRMEQPRLDKNAGPLRRALQYAYYDWTREMPRSKRLVTWAGILMQGYAVHLTHWDPLSEQAATDNRSGTGTFWTADPSMNNVDYSNPATWNAYAYTNGDPINFNDPHGLSTCGEQQIVGGEFNGQTVSQVMTGTSGNDMLAQLIWHEDGTIYPPDHSDYQDYFTDQLAVGTAVMNQLAIDDGKMKVYQNGAAVCPLGQCLNRSLAQIIEAIATYSKQGTNRLIHLFNSSGQMVDGMASVLNGIIGTAVDASPTVLDNGLPTNIGCEGVLSSLNAASDVLEGYREQGTDGALQYSESGITVR